MKANFLIGAAALLLLAFPAAAQNGNSRTIDPIALSKQAKKPPLQLSDERKSAILNALVAEDTQQKTPKDFKPQAGMELPHTMKVDAMPEALGREQPVLKQYGYAKTANDILVLDPMKKTIIAVLPRKFPNDAKARTAADWADTHGMTARSPAR